MRAWLGLTASEDVPQLPRDLADRLVRREEYEHSHRDQWGNWEFSFCDAFHAGRLWETDVDAWVAATRRELGQSTTGLWPGGRPFAVCLTHDVDLVAETVTARQAVRSMRTSLLGAGPSRRDRLLRPARPAVRGARAVAAGIRRAPDAEALERCVELEQERGVTATYFFTVYPGSTGHRYDCVYEFGDACRFRGEHVEIGDVVRTLRREGFDVGLHGSYNSALAPGLLRREREAVEAIVGGPVVATRQHFLHWDIRVTPALQESAGLRADSTLAFNRNVGARAGTSLPFRWYDLERGRALDLVQVPPLVQDGALLRNDALELDVELASRVLGAALDRAERTGGLLTVVFHPNNLADARYLQLFRTLVEAALARGAWFGSVAEVDELWRRREQAARS